MDNKNTIKPELNMFGGLASNISNEELLQIFMDALNN